MCTVRRLTLIPVGKSVGDKAQAVNVQLVTTGTPVSGDTLVTPQPAPSKTGK